MDLTPAEEIELIQLLDMDEQERVFQPQPGPQEVFLGSTADIVLFGGAAGSGKSHSLLLENLRHVNNPRFGSVIFRRESTQITTEGGLWDSACDLYSLRGARPVKTPQMMMIFPSGAKVAFRHLQYDDDVYAWQGSQVPLICFDELCSFSRKQFFYLLSRNRSMCGVKPYMRATCNPDADSWVAEFITWWIDPSGYPIPERSGVIRFFIVINDEILWASTREELAAQYHVLPQDAKSFTFIASSIYDNKILLAQNPEYLANLKALGTVERGRLLDGNWKIRPAAGMYFPRDKAQIIPVPPSPVVAVCRGWDLAATEANAENRDPDATAGVLIARCERGEYIVLNDNRGQWHAADVEIQINGIAVADRACYPNVTIRIPQDPGQAGKVQAHQFVIKLAGFAVKTAPVSGNKIVRAAPLSSQWQAGNVYILEGDWNGAYLSEMDAFPSVGVHDDRVDASSDAFAEVALNQEPYAEMQVTTYDNIMSDNYYSDYFR